MNDKRKPGRPALPPDKKLAVVPVRLTAEQKARPTGECGMFIEPIKGTP